MSGNDPSTDATDTVPTSRAGPADVGDGGVDEMSWSIGTGLDGKSVVVTGAAGGIGRAVAAAFAAASARVCAVDVDGAAVREVVEELGAGRHIAEQFDVRDLASHDGLLRRAQEAFGRFDVLANAAAVLIRRADVDEVTEEDWDTQHDVNLKAAFFLNRAAARLLREQARGGRVINLTSHGRWGGGVGGAVAVPFSKGGNGVVGGGVARTEGGR